MKRLTDYVLVIFLVLIPTFSSCERKEQPINFNFFPQDAKHAREVFNSLSWEHKLNFIKSKIPGIIFRYKVPSSPNDIMFFNPNGSGLRISLGGGGYPPDNPKINELYVHLLKLEITNKEFLLHYEKSSLKKDYEKFTTKFLSVKAINKNRLYGLEDLRFALELNDKPIDPIYKGLDPVYILIPIKNPTRRMRDAVEYYKKYFGLK